MVKRIFLTIDDETHKVLKRRKGYLSWEEYLIKPKLEEIMKEAEKS